ncbi:MAG: DNA repair protein MmcB-related protein [Rhodobacteraceae bacterium]|nr:MAG: DNA repair protein MmcB-related protein [Paracoccaceae bacterium]
MTEAARDMIRPGQSLARGVCRALAGMGFAPLTEFIPGRGLRVDVIALGPKGEIWIVECKSSRADFQSDRKWQGYLPWCDRFFWAVGQDFPVELLPDGAGVMLGDSYGAEIVQMPAPAVLAGARRKALVRGIARQAALRLARMGDPLLEAAP